jgi:hypothetical protein
VCRQSSKDKVVELKTVISPFIHFKQGETFTVHKYKSKQSKAAESQIPSLKLDARNGNGGQGDGLK